MTPSHPAEAGPTPPGDFREPSGGEGFYAHEELARLHSGPVSCALAGCTAIGSLAAVALHHARWGVLSALIGAVAVYIGFGAAVLMLWLGIIRARGCEQSIPEEANAASAPQISGSHRPPVVGTWLTLVASMTSGLWLAVHQQPIWSILLFTLVIGAAYSMRMRVDDRAEAERIAAGLWVVCTFTGCLVGYTIGLAVARHQRPTEALPRQGNIGDSRRRLPASLRVLCPAVSGYSQSTALAYNLADQPTTVTDPATGQTGMGQGYTLNTYQYVGGPLAKTEVFNESGTEVREVAFDDDECLSTP